MASDEEARAALLVRRRQLRELVEAQGSLQRQLADQVGGDDVAAAASTDEAMTGLERLRHGEVSELAAIDRALARVASGTYGVCEICRRRIGARRLAIVPWADTCRTCRDRADGRLPLRS